MLKSFRVTYDNGMVVTSAESFQRRNRAGNLVWYVSGAQQYPSGMACNDTLNMWCDRSQQNVSPTTHSSAPIQMTEMQWDTIFVRDSVEEERSETMATDLCDAEANTAYESSWCYDENTWED